MPYLLDTHALMWWWLNDEKLSRMAMATMMTKSEPVFVSVVSAIEIGIKVRVGRLPEMRDPLLRFEGLVRNDGFNHLPVDYNHARTAGLLPGDHPDPFDRLIAAQALAEGMAVITRDPAIAAFGCDVIW